MWGPCLKRHARCSPHLQHVLSLSSASQGEQESAASHNAACAAGYRAHCVLLFFAILSSFVCLFVFVVVIVVFVPRPLCRFPAEPREGSREGPEVTLAPSDPTLGKEMRLQYGEVKTQALSRRACICMAKKKKKNPHCAAAGGVASRRAHVNLFSFTLILFFHPNIMREVSSFSRTPLRQRIRLPTSLKRRVN